MICVKPAFMPFILNAVTVYFVSMINEIKPFFVKINDFSRLINKAFKNIDSSIFHSNCSYTTIDFETPCMLLSPPSSLNLHRPTPIGAPPPPNPNPFITQNAFVCQSATRVRVLF